MAAANKISGLTSAGLRLYGKVQHGDTPLQITRIIIGTGYLADGETVESLAAVKSPVDVEVQITGHDIIGDGQTALYISLGAATEDYELREIGVMASDPDEGEILYSYVNFSDRADYIDAYDSHYVIPQEGIIYTAIGNAQELVINESGAEQLTRKEFLDHTQNTDNPHNVTAEQVFPNNAETLKQISAENITEYSDAAAAKHTHGNKSIIDGITQALITAWNSAVSHISNKANPHSVTKAQVGLGNVTNESKATMFSSPEFTGIPKAPTAAEGTSSTQLATTAFVAAAIADIKIRLKFASITSLTADITTGASEESPMEYASISAVNVQTLIGDIPDVSFNSTKIYATTLDELFLYCYIDDGTLKIAITRYKSTVPNDAIVTGVSEGTVILI
ncbi:MAG: hypothetical protein ACI4EA_08450 [Candidatus Ornithomonoglobus sp.]